jgi:hypothetical protein
MRIHAIRTGSVAIRQRQVHGAERGLRRSLNTMLDQDWTDARIHRQTIILNA